MQCKDEFRLAEAEAEAAGVCPVDLLEAFCTNHWDFGTLCAGFACGECVATLEDIGYGAAGEEAEPAPATELGGDWEIPF